ncbi:hypothetical protein BRC90_05825 [Halobacteriales archaeon QS_4_69_34]|nr:MAG: hypothetical protein BRC90_05825 [Halobacteriales archaeon QS_4_69_34]
MVAHGGASTYVAAVRTPGVSGYDLGFRSVREEISGRELSVEGRFPDWLSGQYVRNGPGAFEAGGERVAHWFDGLAMLAGFSFGDGVTYTNRFLRTRAYREAASGAPTAGAFAEPAGGVLGRLRALTAEPTDNANANVVRLGGRLAAITESPVAVAVDPGTLATERVVQFEDDVGAQHTTAHPARDARRGELVGYGTRFGLRNRYELYRLPDGHTERELLGTVRVDEPAYMHDFALTERFAVLVEHPLTAAPIDFLRPEQGFIDAYEWQPERGTRFLLLDRATGDVIADPRVSSFFTFHCANAFESGDEVVIDLVAYGDASVLGGLYLADLDTSTPDASTGQLCRYRVPLDGGRVSTRTIADVGIEFPRVSPAVGTEMEPHRYVYGQGSADPDRAANELVKIDVETGEVWTWSEPGVYAGEPAFVPTPDADREDDGVVLSVLLDVDAERSALLALDGGSFQERARARTPHPLPFGFHGRYFPASGK